MAKVLLFNIGDDKGIKIKNLCRKLYISAQDVEKAEFGCRLGYLLGAGEDDTVSAGEDFDDEMLYLSGIDGGMLNIFLSQLRLKKVPVALKAICTETNINYTAYELFRELSAEREALSRGMQAHGE
jgi:hypothetical protein